MILQALHQYYQRLADDPDYKVAPLGCSWQKISFCVVLNVDGSLFEIRDERVQKGEKLLRRSVIVPGTSTTTGKGINPRFLAQGGQYLLGYKPDDDKPERTRQCFQAFRERHLNAERAIDDSEFSAVCTFLKQWEPSTAGDHPALAELGTGFGVFRIRATDHYVHDRPAVCEWWSQQLASDEPAEDETIAQCLVTGEWLPIARLHTPKIKGVWGGQSEALLCSVDKDFKAGMSYGKFQGYNFPVSEQSAFQYSTALNRLLADDRHRVQIGDASTVFWTAQPTEAEVLLPMMMDPSRSADDEELTGRIQSILKCIRSGEYPGELGDQETEFYVLGLSPNAARISVRFWWVSTLGGLIENLHQHFADLAIARSERDPEFPAVWRLLRETVRDSKDLPPLLIGTLMRSILTGQQYPQMLLSSLIRRIRSDRTVRHVRTAIIKACLNRNYLRPIGRELGTTLDQDRTDGSYVLGRLFAEVEVLQGDAVSSLKGAIRERSFGGALGNPIGVFPHLLSQWQYYLRKLERPKEWKGEKDTYIDYREHRILSVISLIQEIPVYHNIVDQGLFIVGYAQQIRHIYTPKASSGA